MSVRASSWAWEQRCPAATKTVLLALADHADDEGTAWPGRKGLADKVGITDRNITRHLSILERAGIIVSVPRYRPDGSRTSNLYRLVMSNLTPPLDNNDQTPWIDSSIPLDNSVQARTVIEPSLETSIKASTPKGLKTISPEFRARMKEKYGAKLGDVDSIINDALNHKASDKWKNVETGVDGWLRRQVGFQDKVNDNGKFGRHLQADTGPEVDDATERAERLQAHANNLGRQVAEFLPQVSGPGVRE